MIILIKYQTTKLLPPLKKELTPPFFHTLISVYRPVLLYNIIIPINV